jgi:quercetin dioxygenase-like cupin family protein
VLLQVVEHRGPTELPAAVRITYRLAEDAAERTSGPVTVDGHVLCFELVEEASPGALLAAPVELGGERLIRLDRVDFPPGGVAYLHTHRGPGIRVLIKGRIRIETNGTASEYDPLQAWFEAGREPVYAAASETDETAFVRCMVLPAELLGRSSIAYVRAEDRDKPKRQRYTGYVDEPL